MEGCVLDLYRLPNISEYEDVHLLTYGSAAVLAWDLQTSQGQFAEKVAHSQRI